MRIKMKKKKKMRMKKKKKMMMKMKMMMMKEAFMPLVTVFYRVMKLKFGARVLFETV
jgi:hypothetical protein